MVPECFEPKTVKGQCPFPEQLSFAFLLNKTELQAFPPGSILRYQCRPGYFKRTFSLSCLPDSAWTQPPLGVCRTPRGPPLLFLPWHVIAPHIQLRSEKGPEKSCPVPPDVLNGRVEVSSLEFGAVIKYKCEEGFRLIGMSSAMCLISENKLMWDQDPPICDPIPCGNPPPIANGRISNPYMSNFLYGVVVTYECNKGKGRLEQFQLVGNKSIYCTSEDNRVGIWSGPAPLCIQPGTCTPPDVENGLRDPEDKSLFRLGDSVQLRCQPGFELKGSQSVRCRPENKWEPALPSCSRRCQPPPEILHGWHTAAQQKDFPPGAQLSYTCEPGYQLDGDATLHCTPQGAWSPTPPRCTGRPCAAFLDRPRHGKVLLPLSLLPGAMVSFECDEGFRLKGSSARHCVLVGGQSLWNGRTPECEQIFCRPPKPIRNGSHSRESLASVPYGEEVTYACDPHPDPHKTFKLIGESTIRCGSDSQGQGVWSGPEPRCETAETQGQSCTVPPAPLNGRVLTQPDTQVGSAVHYSCDEGYRLTGSPSATCILSGQSVTWDKEAPVCEEIFCTPPKPIRNGSHSRESLGSVPYGEEVTYACDPHPDPHKTFKLIGESTIRCGSDSQGQGVWSGPEPRCETAETQGQSCTVPPAPLNGRVLTQPDTQVGSAVHYSCDEGYRLTGSPSATCILSGQSVTWDKEAPVCEEIFCTPPKPIRNGSHSRESLASIPYGEEVTYACDPHPDPHMTFNLIGESTIRCGSDSQGQGVWSGPEPRCETVGTPACPHPPKILHGQLIGGHTSPYHPGMSINYSCDPGYVPVGMTFVYCTHLGTWSTTNHACREVFCHRPHLVNGIWKESTAQTVYRYGDNVTMQCDFGHTLEGSPWSQCQANGTWAPSLAVCMTGVWPAALAGK
ncbi:complement receptor type 1-like [Sorex fumeus]|uniref:complement receptor type 1-like n=1 Tax=Sorex fumeus TaxID=62283 RepID=UPI0024AE3890|nr:complement receptor type 1-like [Sorex fumeus]